MAHDIKLQQKDGMIHLHTIYETDLDGYITLDIPIPNANNSVLAMQAMACEFAAAHLNRRAEIFRKLDLEDSPPME
ncbi:hypothetical protein [Massilia rubra]|uniref:HicB-like antitoxin of toxin-antitoxin system domain-containing protein n=1 Tax=Massilia rubra TaxID=2607910 RepID=A0ABX0LV73_9BURK|nr:hypothetical protein [Massilia rubra]NHZ38348.1 hypothetical protein [Massilia rubra]